MKPVNTLMQRAISETVFPGAVLLVAHQDQVVFCNAYGVANLATQIRINQETLFDLASLTKPLATTLGIMYLVQKEKLELSDTVARVLAEFKNSNKAMVTIQALLTHTSGLPDYRPYFKKLSQTDPSHSKKVLREFLVNEPLEYRPEQQTVYSDLGFMILAWILEQISGDSLNQFVESKIYAPLGIKDLFLLIGKLQLPSVNLRPLRSVPGVAKLSKGLCMMKTPTRWGVLMGMRDCLAMRWQYINCCITY